MAKTNHWGPLAAAGTVVAVGLVLLIMLVVVEVRPAEATFPGKSGKIAYSGKEGTNADYEIYTTKVGEGGRVQVTDNANNDYEPCYSPDGKRIAYTGKDGPNGDYEIYSINARGGGKVQLTENTTGDFNPDYSPNGKKIAYTGDDGNDRDIYTINASGGGKKHLTDNSTPDEYPYYSPSGKRIAYVNDAGTDEDIWTIHPAGEVGSKSPTTVVWTAIFTGAVNSDFSLLVAPEERVSHSREIWSPEVPLRVIRAPLC